MPVAQPVEEPEQLERAERLAEEPVRARRRRLLLGHVRAGQEDHGRRVVAAHPLELAAERETVPVGEADVDDRRGRPPEAGERLRLDGAARLLDLELVERERRPQEEAQARVVVDDQHAPHRRLVGRRRGLLLRGPPDGDGGALLLPPRPAPPGCDETARGERGDRDPERDGENDWPSHPRFP